MDSFQVRFKFVSCLHTVGGGEKASEVDQGPPSRLDWF